MYKRKQLSLVTFPIYIGNVTPKLALSLSTFKQLTLLMVNGPSDFNYETFLSDMPCMFSYHSDTTGNHFAHPKYSNILLFHVLTLLPVICLNTFVRG